MASLPPVIVFDPSKHSHLIASFAFIHVLCVETDDALLNFHPPFDHTDPEVPDTRVLNYWKEQAKQATGANKIIFMQLVTV
jgi:hypothetical protein